VKHFTGAIAAVMSTIAAVCAFVVLAMVCGWIDAPARTAQPAAPLGVCVDDYKNVEQARVIDGAVQCINGKYVPYTPEVR